MNEHIFRIIESKIFNARTDAEKLVLVKEAMDEMRIFCTTLREQRTHVEYSYYRAMTQSEDRWNYLVFTDDSKATICLACAIFAIDANANRSLLSNAGGLPLTGLYSSWLRKIVQHEQSKYHTTNLNNLTSIMKSCGNLSMCHRELADMPANVLALPQLSQHVNRNRKVVNEVIRCLIFAASHGN